MARSAKAEVLEQKIEKHMREHADTMKNFKSELQLLKTKASKDQRPDNNIKKMVAGRNETTRKIPTKSLKGKTSTAAADKGTILNSNNHFSAGDKMTNKMNVQNHPHADEHIVKCEVGSICPTEYSSAAVASSHGSCVSVPESVMTRINYNGSIMSSPLSPIKLLEFLILELKTKLKDYVSEDNEEMVKAFNEINHVLKKAKLERRLARESSHQISPTQVAASTQTDVNGTQMEKLFEFPSKYSSMQSEMDTNLRRMEEIFTLELKKSDDKITKLSEDINSLQHKFRSGIDDKNTTMFHHIDLKTEEIKGEMKFLLRMIEETKNHSLIDNFNEKLAQTQKKIDEVKRKCTESAKHCLQMHVGSHRAYSHTLETKQMECELGRIKSVVDRNVRDLKDVLTRTQSVLFPQLPTSKSTSSSSLCTLNLSSEVFPFESIKSSSSVKLNEDYFHRKIGSRCYASAAAAVADDNDDYVDIEKDNDLMAAKDE